MKKYYEISTIYECVEKLSMTIVCNIWMICLRSELNVATFWIWMDATFFGMSRFEQFFPYRTSTNYKCLFFAISLYPFNFSRTLPLRILSCFIFSIFSPFKNIFFTLFFSLLKTFLGKEIVEKNNYSFP